MLFTSGDSGVYCLVASWELFGWWSEPRRTVSCFLQHLRVGRSTGYYGELVEFSVRSRCCKRMGKGFCPILPSLYHSGTPTYLSLPFCLISCFLFVGHIGRTPEWGGHIWRWFLKRCWLSRPGRECLLSPSQASGVTVAAMTCLSCGSVFGINGPSSLVLQWVTADVAIVNWEMALYGCDIAA